MANAKLDNNGKPAITAILNTDGVTITQIQANKTTHGLSVDDGTTGSDNGNHNGNAAVDDNGKPVLTAMASDGSGIIELYVTSAGALLVDSA